MNTLENLSTLTVHQQVAEPDTLKAQLSVLIVKNEINYGTPFLKVRQTLLSRFDVEYDLSDIEEQLKNLYIELEGDFQRDRVLELEEDYYEGF